MVLFASISLCSALGPREAFLKQTCSIAGDIFEQTCGAMAASQEQTGTPTFTLPSRTEWAEEQRNADAIMAQVFSAEHTQLAENAKRTVDAVIRSEHFSFFGRDDIWGIAINPPENFLDLYALGHTAELKPHVDVWVKPSITATQAAAAQAALQEAVEGVKVFVHIDTGNDDIELLAFPAGGSCIFGKLLNGPESPGDGVLAGTLGGYLMSRGAEGTRYYGMTNYHVPCQKADKSIIPPNECTDEIGRLHSQMEYLLPAFGTLGRKGGRAAGNLIQNQHVDVTLIELQPPSALGRMMHGRFEPLASCSFREESSSFVVEMVVRMRPGLHVFKFGCRTGLTKGIVMSQDLRPGRGWNVLWTSGGNDQAQYQFGRKGDSGSWVLTFEEQGNRKPVAVVGLLHAASVGARPVPQSQRNTYVYDFQSQLDFLATEAGGEWRIGVGQTLMVCPNQVAQVVQPGEQQPAAAAAAGPAVPPAAPGNELLNAQLADFYGAQ